jgi:type VI protein secretion system component Hcp
MSDSKGTELLMQMNTTKGNPIQAESQIALANAADPLLTGFQEGKFFSVDDFAFGMNIDDQDATADPTNMSGAQGVGPAGKRRSSPKVKFGKWKTAPQEELRNMDFPLRMDEFSITRGFDRASPVLFQSCARSLSFQSAALIKRKTFGGKELQTFFRLDFEGVLVTHVGWDDAEVIKETMRFVFRTVTVQYRRQAHDGTLAPAGSATWDYQAALLKKPT